MGHLGFGVLLVEGSVEGHCAAVLLRRFVFLARKEVALVVFDARGFTFLRVWLLVFGSLRGDYLFGVGLLLFVWLLILDWLFGLLCSSFVLALAHAGFASCNGSNN